MKSTIILFVLLSNFVNAQSKYRFVYEYTYVKDSLKKHNIKKEIYHLDISINRSLFYNKNRLSNDTVFSQKFLFSEFDYIIERENTAKSIVQYTNLSGFSYKILDEPELKWEILNSSKKILDYSAQLGKVSFRGREWNAWFSTSLPFNTGPYKFNGLPGLIVKMNDTTNSHLFELVAVQPMSDHINFRPSKPLSISHKSFQQVVKNYRDNPNKELLNIETITTDDGLNNGEFKKRIEEYYKRKMKHENNFIELY